MCQVNDHARYFIKVSLLREFNSFSKLARFFLYLLKYFFHKIQKQVNYTSLFIAQEVWPLRAARLPPPRACNALINRWSPALHELQRFLTFILLSPLNFIRFKRSHFIYDLDVDNYTDNFVKFLQYPSWKKSSGVLSRNVIM